MDFRWFSIIGLGLDIVGSIFLAFGIVVSKEKAVELGAAWLCDGENPENNFDIPPIKDRLDQARNAKIGI